MKDFICDVLPEIIRNLWKALLNWNPQIKRWYRALIQFALYKNKAYVMEHCNNFSKYLFIAGISFLILSILGVPIMKNLALYTIFSGILLRNSTYNLSTMQIMLRTLRKYGIVLLPTLILFPKEFNSITSSSLEILHLNSITVCLFIIGLVCIVALRLRLLIGIIRNKATRYCIIYIVKKGIFGWLSISIA